MKRIYILMVSVLLLTGCRGLRQTVEVPVYVHDTAYVAKEVHDSTYIDRWHTEYVKGDTIFRVDSIYRWRVVWRTDTAYQYIEKPVEVTKTETVEVEKPLAWWQEVLLWLGAIETAIVAGWVASRLLRRY